MRFRVFPGMGEALVQVGGEEQRAGEPRAQGLEDEELVVGVGAQDADRAELLALGAEVRGEGLHPRRKPADVVELGLSLRPLQRGEVRAPVLVLLPAVSFLGGLPTGGRLPVVVTRQLAVEAAQVAVAVNPGDGVFRPVLDQPTERLGRSGAARDRRLRARPRQGRGLRAGGCGELQRERAPVEGVPFGHQSDQLRRVARRHAPPLQLVHQGRRQPVVGGSRVGQGHAGLSERRGQALGGPLVVGRRLRSGAVRQAAGEQAGHRGGPGRVERQPPVRGRPAGASHGAEGVG
jgi:hypothetical protein